MRDAANCGVAFARVIGKRVAIVDDDAAAFERDRSGCGQRLQRVRYGRAVHAEKLRQHVMRGSHALAAEAIVQLQDASAQALFDAVQAVARRELSENRDVQVRVDEQRVEQRAARGANVLLKIGDAHHQRSAIYLDGAGADAGGAAQDGRQTDDAVFAHDARLDCFSGQELDKARDRAAFRKPQAQKGLIDGAQTLPRVERYFLEIGLKPRELFRR